jgi:tetratricopeptide (TPR) repeat protein
MKALLFFVSVAVATSCMAQFIVPDGQTLSLTNGPHPYITVGIGSTLIVENNLVNETGQITLNQNSTLTVRQGSELHMVNTGSYFGYMIFGETLNGTCHINNSEKITCTKLQNLNTHNDFTIIVNNDTAVNDDVFEVKGIDDTFGAFGNLEVWSNMTIKGPQANSSIQNWFIDVMNGGNLTIEAGTNQNSLYFYSPHVPINIQAGGVLTLKYTKFVNGDLLNVDGTLDIQSNSAIDPGEDNWVGDININGQMIVSNSSVTARQLNSYGTISLSASNLYLQGATTLYNGSILTMTQNSLVNGQVDGGYIGSLKLKGGSVIQGSTPPDATNPGDRIIINSGAWMGTEESPTIASYIKLTPGFTQPWAGVILYTVSGFFEYSFKLCDISGIESFIFKGNGVDSNILSLEGCNLHDMGKLFICKRAECHAKTYETTHTTFTNVRYGIIAEDKSIYQSEGCIYQSCPEGTVTAYSSVLNLGGSYNPITGYSYFEGNTFINSNKGLGIVSAFLKPNQEERSVINDNIIGQTGNGNASSGIVMEDTFARIEGNQVVANAGNGFMGKGNILYGVMENTFSNNGGAEFFSDPSSMGALRGGQNTFVDDSINPNGVSLPPAPFNYGYYSYADCDIYFLVKANIGIFDRQTNVAGNTFNGDNEPPYTIPDRFYPFHDSYIFGREESDTLLVNALQLYQDGQYDAAALLFKQILVVEPYTTSAISAISYLMDCIYHTSCDYAAYRTYLTSLEIPSPNPILGEIDYYITKSFMMEGNYESAILRWQDILDNPVNSMDSLYAAINQGYCYYKLSEEGRATPPNCSVKTRTIEELQHFVASLNFNHVTDSGVPTANSIFIYNYANPFNPTTSIFFDLPKAGLTQVAVYNVKGQLVKHLSSENRGKGGNQVFWNGKNNEGVACTSGVYFVKISCGKDSAARKLMLVK